MMADSAARRQFQLEAQMASSLNHPHILIVHDVGDFDGREYLVTEFVDGGTLKDWARGEKPAWRRIVELLAGVADGLATAHGTGILHRDIKPDNILVGRNGYAKLADFGLAKLQEHSTPGTIAQAQGGEGTRSGIIFGTIAYMSPEQASGRSTDARSDIFSFGVVLYELLAGRRPFEGATDLHLLHNIIHAHAEPLGADVPLPLRRIVETALEKDPADRYQAMRDLVIDLRGLIGSSETPTAQRTAPLSRWAAGALIIAVVLAVGSALILPRLRRGAEPARVEYTQLTNFADSATSPALSPDGRMLAFIRGEYSFGGSGQIYVRVLPDGKPIQLTNDDMLKRGSPKFSPDGARIAYSAFNRASGWETWVAPVVGGSRTCFWATLPGLPGSKPNQESHGYYFPN
jgi:hypothetical protein